MTLHLPTLLVVSAAVVLLISALFIAEAWARRGMVVDRLWSLAFMAVVATALASLVSGLAPAIWWAPALANGATVLAVWSMWSGVRAHAGRRPLLELSGLVAALVFAAGVLAGPGAGQWAGGGAMLLAVAVGGFLLAAAVIRSPFRQYRSSVTLVAMALLLGLYYAVRLVGYLTVGPTSPTFGFWMGTELSTLVLVLLVTGAAFAMVALRSAQANDGRLAVQNYDAATGARTPEAFDRRSHPLVKVAAQDGRPLCLVVVVPESIDAIAIAFGQRYAEQALVAVGDVARVHAVQGALLGLQRRNGPGFELLLPGLDGRAGLQWAEELRMQLVDAPLDVPGSRLRLTVSVGVAGAENQGYDLAALRAAADAAVTRAMDAGGNRAVATPPAG